MRFVLMTFVSLFLMTTVSSATTINCTRVKMLIENHYDNAHRYYLESVKNGKKKQFKIQKQLITESDIELDAAAKNATIYLALCKN